jgi:hypothetical protein
MWKAEVHIVTQNQQTVQCEIPTDSRITVETEVDIVTQNQQMVQSELLRDSGKTVEDSSGHIDTETTEGTVCFTDRHWTDYRRKQCTY